MTLQNVFLSLIQRYNSQITGKQEAAIESAILKLAITQTAMSGVDIRNGATSIVQTTDTATGTTNVVYTFANGDVITDVITSVTNGSIVTESLNRGTLMPITSPVILTDFALSADGTTLTYTATGGTVTALFGTVLVSGSLRTLTHVSSGVATVSGNPIASNITGITVSLTATPTLASPISGASVANNSTVAAPQGLTLTPLTWTGGAQSGGTQSGDTITLPSSNTGSIVATRSIDSTLPFEIVISNPSDTMVTYLHDNNTANYVWGTSGNSFIVGTYNNNSILHAAINDGGNGQTTIGASSNYIKLTKDGDNVVISASNDGITYTPRFTQTNALLNKATIYLKVLSAVGGGSATIEAYF